MRISDWSSDVCSSDLLVSRNDVEAEVPHHLDEEALVRHVQLARLFLEGALVALGQMVDREPDAGLAADLDRSGVEESRARSRDLVDRYARGRTRLRFRLNVRLELDRGQGLWARQIHRHGSR